MAQLYETAKKMRKMIMGEVVAGGKVPKVADISDEFHLSNDEIAAVFKDLEAGVVIAVQNEAHAGIDYFQEEKLEEGVPALGEIFYARPFAGFKNHYKISVGGERKWYGECAVEMCGVSAMFPGKEVVVESVCRRTGEPVELVGRDGVLIEYSPKTLRVHLGIPIRYMPDDVVGWCDYNSFFSSEDAADEWRKSHPDIKGITRDPETTSRFVSLIGKGRLDYDYQVKFPVLKVLLNARRYGFTKPLPGLGLHMLDPFWLPTPYMLKALKRKGYKNYIGFSLF